MRALALCALAACTYPDKIFEGPFTCLGAPPPTSAKQLVNIHGHVADPSNLSPISGATVVLENAQGNPVFTGTTDATGSYSFTLNTNGTPVDGLQLHASASTRYDTYLYPARPITDDVDLEIVLLSMSEASALASGAGVQFDASHGAVLPTVDDCNDMPLAGAVLTSSPAGAVRYFDGVVPSPTATATDVGGVALIAQLPLGQVTVSTTVQGMKLPDRHFTAVGNAFVQTFIVP